MGFENYISESEAATVAGVGVATLRRFAEAGYFTIETETDGLRLYPRSQLEKVFGLSRHEPIKEAPPMAVAEEWKDEKREVTGETVIDVALASASPEASVSTETPAPKVETQPKDPPRTDFRPANEPDTQNQRAEMQRAQAINEMQERLLLMREEEIRSLKEEREWLRARIEKFEEKGSRDQLLLLSETQTIKALITIQEQRRSPFRAALEWLGFIAPTSTGLTLPQAPAAIEVKEAK